MPGGESKVDLPSHGRCVCAGVGLVLVVRQLTK